MQKNIFSLNRKKEDLLPAHLAVGPCPYCGRIDNWLNDIPLKAFCCGSEEKPHKQWIKVVPAPFNPYLKNFDKDAVVSLNYEVNELV